MFALQLLRLLYPLRAPVKEGVVAVYFEDGEWNWPALRIDRSQKKGRIIRAAVPLKKYTLIPYLGLVVTNCPKEHPEELSDDFVEYMAERREAWTYVNVDGDPRYHPSSENVGSRGLAIAALICEPSKGEKYNTLIYRSSGFYILIEDVEAGTELNAYYGKDYPRPHYKVPRPPKKVKPSKELKSLKDWKVENGIIEDRISFKDYVTARKSWDKRN